MQYIYSTIFITIFIKLLYLEINFIKQGILFSYNITAIILWCMCAILWKCIIIIIML